MDAKHLFYDKLTAQVQKRDDVVKLINLLRGSATVQVVGYQYRDETGVPFQEAATLEGIDTQAMADFIEQTTLRDVENAIGRIISNINKD